MAFSTGITTKGGEKMRAILTKAEQAKGRKTQVKVGFFSPSEYPDGTKVAVIAAINEFGLDDNPERPFSGRRLPNWSAPCRSN